MLSRITCDRPWVVPSAVALLGATLVIIVGCTSGSHAPPAATSRAEEAADGPPPFADVTDGSGIKFTYRNGEEAGNFAIIESLGGGIALVDYDGDGLLDVFIPGGGDYNDKKVTGHPCKLFRNLGNFKFEDVSAKVGLDKIEFQYSHGGAAFDYDRDGWPDLLVTGYNRLVLLRNEAGATGGRAFVDVTMKAGLKDALWSTSAAWGDLDGDGFPEVYVAHYGDWGFETNHPTDCTYDGKQRDVCQPRRFQALPHTLYKNNGNGTFTDASAAVKLRKDGKGIGALMCDLNNDGRPDVYAANDTDDNFLYINRGKRGELALEEMGLFAGVARDDRGVANGSMGVDAGDYNRSGFGSVFVTNYENELPALYRNRSSAKQVQFNYDSLASGIAAIGGNYVSWGTGFFDLDMDGWDDVLIVSGHAIRFPLKIDRRQKPVLLRNNQGKFKQASGASWAYLRDPHNARGVAFGDLNNDGKPDLVISHLNEPVVVLRNVAPTDDRHWLGIHLFGRDKSDTVGARVVVEHVGGKQTKFSKGGGSYGTTNDPRLLFGLDKDAKLDKVTVYWPSGTVQDVTGLTPDAYWQVTEGSNTPKKLDAAKP